jgi:hypothetical protein
VLVFFFAGAADFLGVVRAFLLRVAVTFFAALTLFGVAVFLLTASVTFLVAEGVVFFATDLVAARLDTPLFFVVAEDVLLAIFLAVVFFLAVVVLLLEAAADSFFVPEFLFLLAATFFFVVDLAVAALAEPRLDELFFAFLATPHLYW